MALASRLVSDRAFWRLPFSLLHTVNLSTSAASNPSQNPTTEASTKPKRKKNKKNLFEVAQFLPNWGLGYHMAKSHWANVSYEITKINLYKDGRHGKAWGLAYIDGVPVPAPKKISGVHKRCWKYIPSPIKSLAEPESESKPNPEAQPA